MKVCGKEVKITGRLVLVGEVDGDGFEFLEDPASVIESLRTGRPRIDLFTFTQRLAEAAPRYSYPSVQDNVAALPVSTFDRWWKDQIDGKTRNMVRRAEKKGVQVREVPFDDDLVRGIWAIYNECPVRQGRPFPHFGKDLEAVRTMSATFLHGSIFIAAFLDGHIIGFAKLTWDETRTQAGIMHILSMAQHRDAAPTNALIAQSVRSCADRGISHLVYSNFAYGKKQDDSLSSFKHNNGFQRVDRPRYYVPLTTLGRIAFRFHLHGNIIDHLPSAVGANIRKVRDAWYKRKLQLKTQLP